MAVRHSDSETITYLSLCSNSNLGYYIKTKSLDCTPGTRTIINNGTEQTERLYNGTVLIEIHVLFLDATLYFHCTTFQGKIM